MAPALVEPSTVPESNSVLNRSNQFSVTHRKQILNFVFDNCCVDGEITSRVVQSVEPVSCKDTSGCYFLQPSASRQVLPFDLSNTLEMLEKSVISEDFDIAKHREFIVNSRQSLGFVEKSRKPDDIDYMSRAYFPRRASCDSSPCQHHIVPAGPKSLVENVSSKAKRRVSDKLTVLSNRLSSCAARVKFLKSRALCSGISSQLLQNSDVLASSSPVNLRARPAKNGTYLPDMLLESSPSTSKSVSFEMLVDPAPPCASKSNLLRSSLGENCDKFYSSACLLEAGASDTDNEEDFEPRVQWPVPDSKKNCDKPAPPADVLFQWKNTRASVGAQSSWLHEKIAELDHRVFVYSKLQQSINMLRPKLELQHQLANSHIQRNPEWNQALKEKSSNLFSFERLTPSSSSFVVCHGAARVCPVQQLPKHKYLRSEEARGMLNCTRQKDLQLVELSCLNSSCAVPCRLCQSSTSAQPPVNLTAARLDHSYHASLSNIKDVMLSVQLEKFCRKENICTKAKVSKALSRRIKKCHVAGSGPLRSASEVKRVRGKVGRDNLRKGTKRRYRSQDSFSGRSKQLKALDFDSAKPVMPSSGRSSPVLVQSHPSGSGLMQSLRRKKGSSTDYDINNIVIPYSMAASTRVERIQYKEIPTPGWRPLSPIFGLNSAGELDQELTDDEVYVERHADCEVEERKRFTTFFQPARKTRPVRTSECVGSEPASPMPSDDISTLKSATAALTDSPGITPSALARPLTRQVSLNFAAFQEDDRDAFWSRRRFPLSEFESRRLQSAELKATMRSRSTNSLHLFGASSQAEHLFKSPLPSPLPTPPSAVSSPTSPMSSPASDDGWTVKLLNEAPSIQQAEKARNSGIVLKLAKR